MPLSPRVVVILGGALLTAGGGLVSGVWGANQIRRAKKRVGRHYADYSQAHERHLVSVNETNEQFRVLGATQELALHEVIYRMRDFLVRNQRNVRAGAHLILDGLDGANRPVIGLVPLARSDVAWVQGIVGSAAAGVATSRAARAAVSRIGLASTGRPLRSLSGAAAQRATQAWWGGGSVASGAGGVALGRFVQHAPLLGPALLVAGISVKVQGAAAHTAANQRCAELAIETALLESRDERLRVVRVRTHEVDRVLRRMIDEATTAINELESQTTAAEIPAGAFQTAITLVSAVREIAKAPIADEDGRLYEQTGALLLRYRDTDEGERE